MIVASKQYSTARCVGIALESVKAQQKEGRQHVSASA